jgi:hypothetical protein
LRFKTLQLAAWCEGGIVARTALSAPGGPCPLHFLLDASTVW